MIDDVQCLSGGGVGVRRLVDELTPVIRVRVVRTLIWHRAHGGSDEQIDFHEVEDFVQDVLSKLWARDARILRRWDRERGLSLRNFVGLVAERETRKALRRTKRRPWTERPYERSTELDLVCPVRPDSRLEARDSLHRLGCALQPRLSPRGMQLFSLLFVEQRPVPTICAETGLARNAVYAWRCRLAKLVRRCS